MKKSLIPISVLDLAPIAANETTAQTLEHTGKLAKHVEALGYNRYWLAEHHNIAGIASSATAVLIGYVASQTSSIKVGSGGIMLPNHPPLIVAEQFGTLATLYPGRIDLGLGRAPGADALTMRALHRDHASADDFPAQVQELVRYFGPRDPSQRVIAIPGEGTEVPIWLLGSSTFSARLAATMGLPFAFAGQFAPALLFDALAIYRKYFQPSDRLKKPYAMVGLPIIAAPTDEEAEFLATTLKQKFLNLVRGTRLLGQPPVENFSSLVAAHEQASLDSFLDLLIVGSVSTIKRSVQDLLTKTHANEILITSDFYDFNHRLRSYTLIAEAVAE